MGDTCAEMVGLILATPENFLIVYAHTRSWPLLEAERLLELFAAFAGIVLEGPPDVVDVGRPRCLDLTREGR